MANVRKKVFALLSAEQRTKLFRKPLPAAVRRELRRIAGGDVQCDPHELAALVRHPPTTEGSGWPMLDALELVLELAALNGKTFQFRSQGKWWTGPSGMLEIAVDLRPQRYGCLIAKDDAGGHYIVPLRGLLSIAVHYERPPGRRNPPVVTSLERWLEAIGAETSKPRQREPVRYELYKGRGRDEHVWKLTVSNIVCSVSFGPRAAKPYQYSLEAESPRAAAALAKRLLAIKRKQGFRAAATS